MTQTEEEFDVEIPFTVDCQYQLIPGVGLFNQFIVTRAHWGELLIGLGGEVGCPAMTAFIGVEILLQHPCAF